MPRVSSKMSLIAAQISSVPTRMTSSTRARAILKVSSPIVRTATPSAKRPTWGSSTRCPAASAACKVGASSGSTPMIRTSGISHLT